tara:strand:- start:170 stop:427 length:258 start_codon:yes stop_codon:yes gene_type:complete
MTRLFSEEDVRKAMFDPVKTTGDFDGEVVQGEVYPVVKEGHAIVVSQQRAGNVVHTTALTSEGVQDHAERVRVLRGVRFRYGRPR